MVAAFPSGVHRRGGDNEGVHFTFPSPNCGHYENALRPTPPPLPPSVLARAPRPSVAIKYLRRPDR